MTIITQAGFEIGSGRIDALTQETGDDNELLVAIKLGKSVESRYVEGFYSQEISRLYDEYLADNGKIKNFEFREQILSAALDVDFNLGQLRNCCNSRWINTSHVEFVKDCFKYLLEEKRSTPVSLWVRVINRPVKETSEGVVFAEEFKRVRSARNGFFDDSLGNELIRIWTSIPGGYSDLLTTLWIIFGRRFKRV